MYGIEIKNLTKEFTGLFGKKRQVAVDNVSLEIRKGEILGLLGPNGAGKTTVLKMICGLVKPTRGEILINGQAMATRRSELLTCIGAVLEGSRNSLWSMTVRQNLSYFGHLKNTHGRILADRGKELLEFFQLEAKKDELVRNLSKGMKQKLAIILAFIGDPDLVLLDEPTLGLDVQTARLLKQRIVQLAKHNQKTVLLTTHQIEVVEEICDRVAILHKGRLIAFENTEKLLRSMGREHYVIKFKGRFDTTALKDLPAVRGVELLRSAQDTDQFSVRLLLDQKDNLFPVLEALQDGHVKILSVTQSEPNLEDIFLKLIENAS